MAKGFIKIRYEVDGEAQFSRVFDSMSTKLSDLRPIFRDIASDFLIHMKRVFSMEGAVDEKSRWVPLAQWYEAYKRLKYPGTKILHLTGRLESSLTEKASPDNVTELRPLEMKIGTKVPYALKHQRGYGLPQRKIIDLTVRQRKRWTSIAHQYVYSEAVRQWKGLSPPYR